jgi:hypothetical protein
MCVGVYLNNMPFYIRDEHWLILLAVLEPDTKDTEGKLRIYRTFNSIQAPSSALKLRQNSRYIPLLQLKHVIRVKKPRK